jgi:hypothetical protein
MSELSTWTRKSTSMRSCRAVMVTYGVNIAVRLTSSVSGSVESRVYRVIHQVEVVGGGVGPC